MSAGWAAGNVRAVGLAQRRIGAARARELAAAGSLTAAQRMLTDGPYRREIRIGATLAATEHAVWAAMLWHLRVLAGWQPRAGARMVRTLAGGFEVANICALAAAITGAPARPPYDPGALGWAWVRLRDAASPAELRARLRNSIWGDPGGTAPADIADAVVLEWAARVSAEVACGVAWAAGAAALLVARRQLLQDNPLPEPALRQAEHLIGASAAAAGELTAFVAALPVAARWVFADVDSAGDLWRAEFHWWSRLGEDGAKLLGSSRFDADKPVGAVAVLAADAWRVRAALQIASGAAGMETYDELV